MVKKILALCMLLAVYSTGYTQTDTNSIDIDELLEEDAPHQKEYARYAFKSTRVIMGQSMEMLGAGVLDFRILHRFGMLKEGVQQLFGLDQASMRMSFDYGITKDLGIGIGRSTYGKELDGFVKWRIAHQHTGHRAIPFSLLLVSGMTVNTMPPDPSYQHYFTHRLGYFHQLIIGRKFNDAFTLQLAPTFVHRNVVPLASDKNDIVALGIGSRYRISRRTNLILDAYPILYGGRSGFNQMPLSIGVDIETGGHVFQLHISNARGMNEKSFISETTQSWGKGEISFGFNLSRVFTVKKNTASW